MHKKEIDKAINILHLISLEMWKDNKEECFNILKQAINILINFEVTQINNGR